MVQFLFFFPWVCGWQNFFHWQNISSSPWQAIALLRKGSRRAEQPCSTAWFRVFHLANKEFPANFTEKYPQKQQLWGSLVPTLNHMCPGDEPAEWQPLTAGGCQEALCTPPVSSCSSAPASPACHHYPSVGTSYRRGLVCVPALLSVIHPSCQYQPLLSHPFMS